jgi:hypothetical protein
MADFGMNRLHISVFRIRDLRSNKELTGGHSGKTCCVVELCYVKSRPKLWMETMGGRFGKYGDTKRKAKLRQSGPVKKKGVKLKPDTKARKRFKKKPS